MFLFPSEDKFLQDTLQCRALSYLNALGFDQPLRSIIPKEREAQERNDL